MNKLNAAAKLLNHGRGRMAKTTRSTAAGKGAGRRWSVVDERSNIHGTSSRIMRLKPIPGARVLVAEDDGRRRNALRNALMRLGMRVRTVDNPYDILAEVGAFKPRILFLDDRFSESGIEYRDVMAKLRERFPGLRVVVTYPENTPAEYDGHDAKTAPLTWGAIGSLAKGEMSSVDKVRQSVMDAVSA